MSAVHTTLRSCRLGARRDSSQQPFRWGQLHSAPAQLATTSVPQPDSRRRLPPCSAEGSGAPNERSFPQPFSLPVMDDHGLDLTGATFDDHVRGCCGGLGR